MSKKISQLVSLNTVLDTDVLAVVNDGETKKVTKQNLLKEVNADLDEKASDADLDAHIANVSNPHSVNKAQVGLGNVTNDAQVKVSDVGILIPSLTAGKIPTSQLPALAITEVSVVSSQAAQLAITAEEGDVVVRSDLNKSYIHNGGTSGTMADWSELLTPTDNVLSVNGQTNVVVLTKSDIGLGNVENTADVSKPVSTAQAAANAAVQAHAIQRSNHTGTQPASTISDFAAAVAAIAAGATSPLTLTQTAIGDVPLTLKGMVGQTASFLDVKNSDNTVLVQITKDGDVIGRTFYAGGNGGGPRMSSSGGGANMELWAANAIFGFFGTYIYASGGWGVTNGYVCAGGINPFAQLASLALSTGSIGLGIKLVENHAANAAEIRNHLNVVLSGFNSKGELFIPSRTPASASATGVTGTILWDADYAYVCVATNTWKRTPLSTW